MGKTPTEALLLAPCRPGDWPLEWRPPVQARREVSGLGWGWGKKLLGSFASCCTPSTHWESCGVREVTLLAALASKDSLWRARSLALCREEEA